MKSTNAKVLNLKTWCVKGNDPCSSSRIGPSIVAIANPSPIWMYECASCHAIEMNKNDEHDCGSR